MARVLAKTAVCLSWFVALFIYCASSHNAAQAEIKKESIFVAANIKNNAYIREGLFTGGDRTTDQIAIQNIRRSSNKRFERIVIDLKKLINLKPLDLQHPPYFQAALHPKGDRLVITLWGNPQLSFNAKKVASAFKQSSIIKSIRLLPKLEDDSWTFYLDLKPGSLVEVFELSQPVRIIVDIKKGHSS